MKRRRRLPSAFKVGVAAEAAAGNLAKSGAKVLNIVRRFRRHAAQVQGRAANKWARDHASRYWSKVRECMGVRPPA
eukprot:9005151-Alexandrium_andersonii.AAC.1